MYRSSKFTTAAFASILVVGCGGNRQVDTASSVEISSCDDNSYSNSSEVRVEYDGTIEDASIEYSAKVERIIKGIQDVGLLAYDFSADELSELSEEVGAPVLRASSDNNSDNNQELQVDDDGNLRIKTTFEGTPFDGSQSFPIRNTPNIDFNLGDGSPGNDISPGLILCVANGVNGFSLMKTDLAGSIDAFTTAVEK